MSFEEIEIRRGDVSARVSPERGGLITSLSVGGKEILYLDRATFDDPTKNVRGGIPILFPFCGMLEDGLYVPAGTKMKQHGFARNKAWEVHVSTPDTLSITLAADDETRALWPHDFRLEQTIVCKRAGLRITLTFFNLGDAPAPISPGWHPYFRCPAARKGEIRGDAPGLDPTRFTDAAEFDFGIEAPADGVATFAIPGPGKLRLDFSQTMRHLQFWSLPGKDYVCIEPFFGPANSINRPDHKRVEPGASEIHTFSIDLV